MDALAWKIAMGGRSAIVVTNLKEHCKVRNFPLELQIRCFEAPVQPSSEPQIKSCTNPSAGIFTLLASRTVFPASLRFLWFNKSSEVGIGEGKKTDLNISLVNNSIEDGAMESRNGFGCNDPSPRSQSGDMKIDENNGESFRSGAQKETTVENRSIFSHCNQFDMLESSDEHDPALVTGREAKPGNEESNVPVSVSTEEEVEPPAESENGSGEISSISESKQIKSEETDQERDTNWVVRILELRSYWKDQKKCSPISDSNAASSDQMISSTPEIEPCVSHKQVHCPSEKVVKNSCSEECDHNCMFSCRGDDFLSSVMQEDPCIKVTHDRDSFLRFLHPVSSPEVKALAQMSFLCNLAYTIPQIKPGDLWKYYRLRFVTSSLDKKLEASAKARELTAILESSSTAFTCEKEKDDSNSEDGPKLRLSVSPSVAYEIAASAASYVHSQTKYILPFQSGRDTQADDNEKLSSDTKDDEIADKNNHMSNDAKKDPVMDRRVAVPDAQHTLTGSSPQTELSGKVSAGISKSEMAAFVAASSVTAVVAAKEEAKQAAAKDLWSLHSSPCEWFICDDCSRHTRFFVIQGSESLASWQANLFFEPTQFEGYGVLVHRGIYEAAKGLYEQLLPEVLDHLRMHGDTAQLRFTGHSLGGSLSVLLSLMLLIRGAVPSASLLPVITFGSPCIMCGGDYLLQKLGLSNNHVQAIMMHRDIVPRAFACNYPNHVAEVLKRLNGRFRNHPCLNRQKLLYAPMGQLLILQPDEKISPPHPLLPSGCGLYILRYPMHGESEHESSRTAQVRAAQTTFFNSPHPLETLSDPGAYGSEGSISRDHDASNYLRAINYVIRQQTKHLRRLHREQRRRMWWPLVSAEDSMPSQETSKAGINMGIKMSGDMVCVLEQPMSHT